MKTKDEFEAFFQRELKNILQPLENRRLELVKKYSLSFFLWSLLPVFLTFTGIVALGFMDPIPWQITYLLLPIVLVSAVGVPILIMRSKLFRPMRQEYKLNVITRIISFVDPHLKYQPNDGLSIEEFRTGGMFLGADNFKSEDLVSGKVGEAAVRMSDIHAIRRTGKRKFISFAGLYIICEAPYNFAAKVFISSQQEPDYNTIGDPAFDGSFVLKCDNPAVWKALLTTHFIQVLTTFQKNTGQHVNMVFADNHVHIAIHDLDTFEWKVSDSFTDKSELHQLHFHYLNLALGIAEEVNKKTAGGAR